MRCITSNLEAVSEFDHQSMKCNGRLEMIVRAQRRVQPVFRPYAAYRLALVQNQYRRFGVDIAVRFERGKPMYAFANVLEMVNTTSRFAHTGAHDDKVIGFHPVIHFSGQNIVGNLPIQARPEVRTSRRKLTAWSGANV
jgi:hypothetical protein